MIRRRCTSALSKAVAEVISGGGCPPVSKYPAISNVASSAAVGRHPAMIMPTVSFCQRRCVHDKKGEAYPPSPSWWKDLKAGIQSESIKKKKSDEASAKDNASRGTAPEGEAVKQRATIDLTRAGGTRGIEDDAADRNKKEPTEEASSAAAADSGVQEVVVAIETPELSVIKEVDTPQPPEDTESKSAKRRRFGAVEVPPINPNKMSVIPPDSREVVEQEARKLVYAHSQEGPYYMSQLKDKPKYDSLEKRTRREITRVPKIPPLYEPYETSFRRIPKDVLLPDEHLLRNLAPAQTALEIKVGYAHIAEASSADIDSDPLPVEFSALYPKNYDPKKCYPYMVALADNRNDPMDFEDMCHHLFERKAFREGFEEQEWVIFCPVILTKWNFHCDMSGVIGHFCDWVATNYNVENGKVHLMGKGHGGFAALRAVSENKNLCLSVIAILGRAGNPLWPKNPRKKILNYHGIHSLVFIPGHQRKTDFTYKLKLSLEFEQVRPPMRIIHFADVRDHQVYYAINPVEFFNYLLYFRRYNANQVVRSDEDHDDEERTREEAEEAQRKSYPHAPRSNGGTHQTTHSTSPEAAWVSSTSSGGPMDDVVIDDDYVPDPLESIEDIFADVDRLEHEVASSPNAAAESSSAATDGDAADSDNTDTAAAKQ